MSNRTKHGSHYIWTIDLGHAGEVDGMYLTPGKRSQIWSDGSQYFEGVGNRIIGGYLEELLIEGHIDHAFTVIPTDPRDIPLWKRANAANRIEAERPSVLVSIHSNGFSNESANGFEIFTSPGQSASDPIAEIFIKNYAEDFPEIRLRSDKSDGDLDQEAKFAMLTRTHGRAILVESMFHTNERECKILMSEEGKRRIARSLYRSILKIEYLAEQGKL